jgi:hypothetical protein
MTEEVGIATLTNKSCRLWNFDSNNGLGNKRTRVNGKLFRVRAKWWLRTQTKTKAAWCEPWPHHFLSVPPWLSSFMCWWLRIRIIIILLNRIVVRVKPGLL